MIICILQLLNSNGMYHVTTSENVAYFDNLDMVTQYDTINLYYSMTYKDNDQSH